MPPTKVYDTQVPDKEQPYHNSHNHEDVVDRIVAGDLELLRNESRQGFAARDSRYQNSTGSVQEGFASYGDKDLNKEESSEFVLSCVEEKYRITGLSLIKDGASRPSRKAKEAESSVQEGFANCGDKDSNKEESSEFVLNCVEEKYRINVGKGTDSSLLSDVFSNFEAAVTSSSAAQGSSNTASQTTPGAIHVAGIGPFTRRNRHGSSVAPDASSLDENDDNNAISADVVDEEALEAEYQERLMQNVVDATHVDVVSEGKEKVPPPTSGWQRHKCKIVVGVLVGLVAIVGGVTGVLVASGDNEAPQAATPTKQSDLDYLLNILVTVSGEDKLNDETTPQARASQWMLGEKANNFSWPTSTSLLIERYALAVLYFATGGPDWKGKLSFLSPVSVCEWGSMNSDTSLADTSEEASNGVRCDGSGQVVELRLDDNNLNGTLPSELSALPYMECLSLLVGNLHGTIPSELGDCSWLSFLQLHINALTGSIPQSFEKLSNLETMRFNDNRLTGTIPNEFLHTSFQAKLLDFSNNFLEGTIPAFNTQGSVRKAYFANNHFVGPIPQTMYGNKLEVLSISNNSMTGTIARQIGLLDDLVLFEAYGNKFSGTLPTTVGSLKDLQELSVRGNALTGTIPTQLGKLVRLNKMDLSDNHFSGSLPEKIGDMEGLDFLSVAFNNLIGSLPASMAELTGLQELLLTNTSITDGLEEAFCNQSIETPSIEADCGGDFPEVECSCCFKCCIDGKGCV